MLNEHQPLPVNALWHMAGAIVFGIFLVLAFKSAAGRYTRQSILSIASAALALTWNAGSFATLLLHPGAARWSIEAVTVCSLSFLPAVLLHLSLDGKFRSLAFIGYLLGVMATLMHLVEGLFPAAPLHRSAIWVIVFGFGALTIIYAVRVLWEGRQTRQRTSQIIASMSLLLFAVTFSHFASGHPNQPWKEVLIHHAGIPIALLILLQDYRFVFLDAFVRFLANVIFAAALGYGARRVSGGLAAKMGSTSPLAGVFGLAGLCGLLILFAYLRGIIQRLLTRAVFRTAGMERAVQELRLNPDFRDEREYIQWASARLAAAAGTSAFEVLGPEIGELLMSAHFSDLDYPTLTNDRPLVAYAESAWAEAIVPIRLSQGEMRFLLLGRRRGGRRYLSEDLRVLNYLSAVVAQEVERFRAAEVRRLVSEAELRALHSQINPHFLFNTLNTIYGIIPREATAARRTILNLADIFRYFLQSDKTLIPLSEELKIVRAYLDIERLRLGPRLHTVIDVDQGAEAKLIPVLSVQPLVENAIKHGLSKRPDEGWLRLQARLLDGELKICVEDSGAGAYSERPASRTGRPGVGLANVSRRLQLCFGPASEVRMQQSESGTRVEFSVPADAPHLSPSPVAR